MENWPFRDPPNVAVVVNRRIVSEHDWIAYVSHDEPDGGWQFHNKGSAPTEVDALVVSLREILQLDPTVAELSDLPLGWHAQRESKASPWHRSKSQP